MTSQANEYGLAGPATNAALTGPGAGAYWPFIGLAAGSGTAFALMLADAARSKMHEEIAYEVKNVKIIHFLTFPADF